ncbi:MAG: hypothetical protein AUH29_05380 [Candidatus Rokubacteria bacterium 13_1_40CM_69_27]|nr:MAG: hypothetical protein AUH29_05380 [Candidatus Rokubacteria bacterium 13_1_40CM_69_27]
MRARSGRSTSLGLIIRRQPSSTAILIISAVMRSDRSPPGSAESFHRIRKRSAPRAAFRRMTPENPAAA